MKSLNHKKPCTRGAGGTVQAAAGLFVAIAGLAPAGEPYIAYVYPAGAQQGTTVEAEIGGQGFEDVQAIRINGKGVTGEVLDVGASKMKIRDAKVKKAEQTKTLNVRLTVARDAEPGRRELRVITAGGVSNWSRFMIGQLVEVREKEKNSDVFEAQPIPGFPVTVNGQIFGADKDVYRFTAKVGQTIVFETHARRILPYIADAVPGWFQPVLTLNDAEGRSLDYVDDFRFHPDPVLIHRFEADGEYSIEIRDALYRGRNDFVYRLRMGQLPFITHMYPMGGRRGTRTPVRLFGVHLPSPRLTLYLYKDDPDMRLIHVKRSGLISNDRPFQVSDVPEFHEKESNDALRKANRVALPVTINGRINRPGDVDCFAFDVESKQVLVVDVRGRRLDSPIDPIIEVFQGARGRRLAEEDDTVDPGMALLTHQADPYLIHTLPAKGRYVVRVRDVQGKGGPGFTYRMRVSEPRPDFALRMLPDHLAVAPGGSAVITAEAIRRDGFQGAVDLKLSGLPDGFAVRGATIPAKQNEIRFTITAPDKPAPSIGPLEMTGVGQIGQESIVRRAQPAQEVMQAFIYKHRPASSEMLLAVTPEAPFTLAAEVPSNGVIEVPRDGAAAVVLRARRTDAARGLIKITADGPPKGLQARAKPIGKDQTESTAEIRVAGNLPVGFTQNLILSGSLKVGRETITQHAPAITIRVVAPDETAAKAAAAR